MQKDWHSPPCWEVYSLFLWLVNWLLIVRFSPTLLWVVVVMHRLGLGKPHFCLASSSLLATTNGGGARGRLQGWKGWWRGFSLLSASFFLWALPQLCFFTPAEAVPYSSSSWGSVFPNTGETTTYYCPGSPPQMSEWGPSSKILSCKNPNLLPLFAQS